MSRHPRWYGAAWSALALAALALIWFDLVQHGARPLPAQAGPHSSVTATPSRVVLPPPGGISTQGAPGPVTVGHASGSPAASAHPSPSPSRPGPSPSPSRPRPPVVAASAAVVVPLRGTAPAVVRVPLVVPGAPPWPLLDLTLSLQ